MFFSVAFISHTVLSNKTFVPEKRKKKNDFKFSDGQELLNAANCKTANAV